MGADPGLPEGIHRFGTRFLNWYVLEEDEGLTLIDAGLPGYWKQFEEALRSIGHAPDDVEAVVITHAHADHTGFAEKVREQTGARVLIHEADAQAAKSGKPAKPEATPVPHLRRPTALRFIAHLTAGGMARPLKISRLDTFDDGEKLNVPGRPRVVHSPGHTPGMCALHVESMGALFAGDELCNGNPFTGREGVQIMPRCTNVSSEQALESLERIAKLDASVLLFGHGAPWHGSTEVAVARAREAGPS